MRVLLLGSAVSSEDAEKYNNLSKKKASISAANYQSSLIDGLRQNGTLIDVLSVPAIASFPNSQILIFNHKDENYRDGTKAVYIPFINIQGIKQLCIRLFTKLYVRKWIRDNAGVKDKLVLMYSTSPAYAPAAIEVCKKSKIHISMIVTDLPEYIYSHHMSGAMKSRIQKIFTDTVVKYQDKCNSYILLTQKMAEKMNIQDKPYIVSEGFYDADVYTDVKQYSKTHNHYNITYAGAINDLYGVRELVAAFKDLDSRYELNLFGDGECSDYIRGAVKNVRNINYYGRVSRSETVEALCNSDLLIINKQIKDELSNYSFSSKILEYMGTGVPVLMTPVGGLPTEYYEYLYLLKADSIDDIASSIKKVFSLAAKDRKEKGDKARKFVEMKKNKNTMCKEINSFLSNQFD